MSSIHLLDLAARHAQWLSVRQSTIAGNVANANTPAFRARDIQPFADVLSKSSTGMVGTHAKHLITEEFEGAGRAKPGGKGERTHSGNTVDLDEEMIKAGEIAREYSLNTSIVKVFHRMAMATAKG